MSLPAVSKHFACAGAGRIESRRQLRGCINWKLEAKPMRDAQKWIEEYRRFWEENLDRLDVYLKQLQTKEKTDDLKK